MHNIIDKANSVWKKDNRPTCNTSCTSTWPNIHHATLPAMSPLYSLKLYSGYGWFEDCCNKQQSQPFCNGTHKGKSLMIPDLYRSHITCVHEEENVIIETPFCHSWTYNNDRSMISTSSQIDYASYQHYGEHTKGYRQIFNWKVVVRNDFTSLPINYYLHELLFSFSTRTKPLNVTTMKYDYLPLFERWGTYIMKETIMGCNATIKAHRDCVSTTVNMKGIPHAASGDYEGDIHFIYTGVPHRYAHLDCKTNVTKTWVSQNLRNLSNERLCREHPKPLSARGHIFIHELVPSDAYASLHFKVKSAAFGAMLYRFITRLGMSHMCALMDVFQTIMPTLDPNDNFNDSWQKQLLDAMDGLMFWQEEIWSNWMPNLGLYTDNKDVDNFYNYLKSCTLLALNGLNKTQDNRLVLSVEELNQQHRVNMLDST